MIERFIAIILEPITQPLEAIMADVKQVLADLRAFKTELDTRLDKIDDVIERLRGEAVDQATVDELATEVSGLRTSAAAIDPEDPSGDDADADDGGDPPIDG